MDSAEDLLVTGVTRTIFVNNNGRILEKKLLAGHRVRVLLVNPASPAIEMAYIYRDPEPARVPSPESGHRARMAEPAFPPCET